MDKAVDGRRSGYRVLENLVPLGKDQVGRYQNASALAPLGQECEEDLYFFTLLLHVSDVIDDECFKSVQTTHLLVQNKIPFGGEKRLDETIGRCEEQRMAFAHEPDQGYEPCVQQMAMILKKYS
jgi:hypothetical protein